MSEHVSTERTDELFTIVNSYMLLGEYGQEKMAKNIRILASKN